MHGVVLLTTACPTECAHCQYSCTASREPWKWMPEETIRRVAEEYSKNDINEIKISGGEPFYDLKKLISAIKILLKFHDPHRIILTTSGFWAVNEETTKEILNILNELGVIFLEVSIDRFHSKKIPISNIENILRIGYELDIKILLRPLFDIQSKSLVDSVATLVLKYRPKIFFAITGPVGRAEDFDKELIGRNKILDLFISKIKSGEKEIHSTKLTYMGNINETIHSTNLRFPSDSPTITAFPNGNIYRCCIATKLTYMGNINETDLEFMLRRFEKTALGYIFLNNLGCSYLFNFLTSRNDICELCKDQPFIWYGNLCPEYIGSKYLSINIKNLNKTSITYDGKHELLLSLRLSENDLSKEIGNEIVNFLKSLKKKNVRFKLARPLPRCLFGAEYLKIIREFKIPKNCLECKELFTVKDRDIQLCNIVNNKRLKFEDIKNRNQIYEFFKTYHTQLKIPDNCKKCIYFIRNQCNGLCLRGK